MSLFLSPLLLPLNCYQPVLTPASIHLVPLSSELSKFQYLIFEPHLQGGVIKYCNTKKQIATVGQRVSVPNYRFLFVCAISIKMALTYRRICKTNHYKYGNPYIDEKQEIIFYCEPHHVSCLGYKVSWL